MCKRRLLLKIPTSRAQNALEMGHPGEMCVADFEKEFASKRG
jgi:hypothetical protein